MIHESELKTAQIEEKIQDMSDPISDLESMIKKALDFITK